jgi:D-alanine-D-alanine ligase
VLGPPERASVCEQPISRAAILSFDDKYRTPGGKKGVGPKTGDAGMASSARIVPAPISSAMTSSIQQMAVQAFRCIGAAGVARVDFLINQDDDSVFVNEINTMPGSLAYYLWEASHIAFDELVALQVELALSRYRQRQKTDFSFATNLLGASGAGG